MCVCFLIVFGPSFQIKFSFLVPSDILETEISGVIYRWRNSAGPPTLTSHIEGLDSPFVVRHSSTRDKSTMFSIALCMQILLPLVELV